MYSCRKDHNTSDGDSVIGNPQCGVLSHREESLLEKACIAVPSTEVLFYPTLLLQTNMVITARSKSRTTKRDNSCLVYIDQTDSVCWRVLEKIFSFKNSTASGYYCLISVLLPTSTQLCTDDITTHNYTSTILLVSRQGVYLYHSTKHNI